MPTCPVFHASLSLSRVQSAAQDSEDDNRGASAKKARGKGKWGSGAPHGSSKGQRFAALKRSTGGKQKGGVMKAQRGGSAAGSSRGGGRGGGRDRGSGPGAKAGGRGGGRGASRGGGRGASRGSGRGRGRR